MPDENPPKPGEKQKSTWEKIPFFVKVILALCVVGILYFFIWGSSTADLPGFIVRVFMLAVMTFLAYFLVQRFLNFLEPKPFSAKENLHARLVNLSTVSVPQNILGKKLITIGSSGFQGTAYGTITGFTKLPYFIGAIKRDEDGKIIYVKDEQSQPTKIPDREFIKSEESEYFFVIKRGALLPKFMYVRCHQKYVMSMDGDVFLKTSNLVPIMSANYVYPYEQIFEDTSRIMLQNMNEIVIVTFDHQHDLIANTTEHALSFNPMWEYSRRLGQETMTNPNG